MQGGGADPGVFGFRCGGGGGVAGGSSGFLLPPSQGAPYHGASGYRRIPVGV